jgi:hypothetical protein
LQATIKCSGLADDASSHVWLPAGQLRLPASECQGNTVHVIVGAIPTATFAVFRSSPLPAAMIAYTLINLRPKPRYGDFADRWNVLD